MPHRSILIFLICILSIQLSRGESALETKLKKYLPEGTTIQKLEARAHFSEVYEIHLPQPLDHDNPAAGTFNQRIFLLHSGRKRPMVMETEGYAARLSVNELSQMLRANQLIVEYRYAGVSRPEKLDWQYLNSVQASADLHRIRRLLRKVYRKKWISTGVSKGGTTALIYKALYPKDVKVVVPYVAPLALAQEDSRTDEHQATIGSDACRQRIQDFQRAILQKRAQIIPKIDSLASASNFTLSLGADKAFEYAVVEYPFSFWQWGASCDDIPSSEASAHQYFTYLNQVVSFDFYSDAVCAYFLPSFYQFMTELGYYSFPKDHVADLLVAEPKPNNLIFAPQETDLSFRPEIGQRTLDYLMKKGNKILYIYGEYDTWTACGIIPSPKTKALRMVQPGGSHSTRIKSFSAEDQELIRKTLAKWLRMEVMALK